MYLHYVAFDATLEANIVRWYNSLRLAALRTSAAADS